MNVDSPNDFSSPIPIYCFDTDTLDPLAQTLTDIEALQEKRAQHLLVCAHCQHAITSESEKIPIRDSIYHHCINPYGIVFNITCFKEAFGCLVEGELVAADSWFPSYYWQYAFCGQCRTHLGWYYIHSKTDYFYGLISDKLLNLKAQ